MDSEGPQNFNVDMTGAKFNVSFNYMKLYLIIYRIKRLISV